MFIGYLKANIFIPYSQSLKDKRRIIHSIKSRVKDNFNVSMAERPLDKWQLCELCFVCVNYQKQYVDNVMFKVEEFIRLFRDIQLLETEKEIL